MISYKNVTLRPFSESDFSDVIRWFTVDTEWSEWDAPWELWGEDDVITQLEWRGKLLAKNILTAPKYHSPMEIDTPDGHVGWVSCYRINGVDDGVVAVGINIPPQAARGKGYGKTALILYMSYLFDRADISELYTQTWSGNYRMIKLAEAIGFEEIGRIRGIRRLNGERYDALTFIITKEEFIGKYEKMQWII
ncbi:MAG: GNAT family N-acetyltransferase [Defluviitaleaceae bacterium]|nr:GNAT family N-acetyltransferase [Defluviitaleaceae bacterium]